MKTIHALLLSSSLIALSSSYAGETTTGKKIELCDEQISMANFTTQHLVVKDQLVFKPQQNELIEEIDKSGSRDYDNGGYNDNMKVVFTVKPASSPTESIVIEKNSALTLKNQCYFSSPKCLRMPSLPQSSTPSPPWANFGA